MHVEWDPETGTFKGLPDVWAKMMPEGVAQDTVKHFFFFLNYFRFFCLH